MYECTNVRRQLLEEPEKEIIRSVLEELLKNQKRRLFEAFLPKGRVLL
jgi:hypothetical protein